MLTSEVPAAPVTRSKTGMVSLAVVAVLLLGATGTFGTLYFAEKTHATELAQQREREIADLTKQLEGTRGEAEKAKSAQLTAEASNWGANECLKAVKKWTDAVRKKQPVDGMSDAIFSYC